MDLLYLLSEPLESLDALVSRGRDVDAPPFWGDGIQGPLAQRTGTRGSECGNTTQDILTLTNVSYVASMRNRYYTRETQRGLLLLQWNCQAAVPTR